MKMLFLGPFHSDENITAVDTVNPHLFSWTKIVTFKYTFIGVKCLRMVNLRLKFLPWLTKSHTGLHAVCVCV